MDEPATAETIIHALSQFRPDEISEEDGHGHDAAPQLEDHEAGHRADNAEADVQADAVNAPEQMSRTELEEEVLRLRGVVHGGSGSRPATVSLSLTPSRSTSVSGQSNSVKRPRPRKAPKLTDDILPTVPDIVRLQPDTGKRVEKDRKTELYKAIRLTMRQTMGMANESDRLPTPAEGTDVPDWLNPTSPEVESWIARIANKLLQDLQDPMDLEHATAESKTLAKVSEEDKRYDVILEAARVTFANYVKRYKSENDDTHAARKARYARNRRRWARRDLKQERRAKARAGLDPSHPLASMDQDALHFDYQSSECSSAGEDSSDDDGDEGYHAEKVRRRAEAWANARETAGAGPSRGSAAGAGVGEYGWASGLGAKVLEIRTPSWRSSQLNEMYATLDSISALASQMRNTPRTASKLPSATTSAGTKSGHVAPSHHRFTMPLELRRRGTGPRGLGASAGKKKKRRRMGEGKGSNVKDEDGGDAGVEEEAERTALHNGAGEDGDQGSRSTTDKGWMWASGAVGVWPARLPLQ